jgi:hypothetical protein
VTKLGDDFWEFSLQAAPLKALTSWRAELRQEEEASYFCCDDKLHFPLNLSPRDAN